MRINFCILNLLLYLDIGDGDWSPHFYFLAIFKFADGKSNLIFSLEMFYDLFIDLQLGLLFIDLQMLYSFKPNMAFSA